MLKKTLLALLALILILVLYLAFAPIDIEPVSYTPPPNPGLQGDFAPNEELKNMELLLTDVGNGPEDITLGPDSMLYTGYDDGNIVRFSLDGSKHEIVANSGGRPLGLKFDAAGNLIIVDATQGLVSMDSLGNFTTLATEADGVKIGFADHLDIAENGIIYFSDATQRSHDVIVEAWELQPTGRLLSYNPKTKECKVELEGFLHFANGVALGPNDEYLLVGETFGLKIHKYWLKGEKTGTSEVFINEIPGFPDNLSFDDSTGIFWLAFPSQRVAELENIFDKPGLRKVLRRLPESITNVKPGPGYGMVIGFDVNGKIIHNLQDPEGAYHDITSAFQVGNSLYIGSLKMNSIGKYQLN